MRQLLSAKRYLSHKTCTTWVRIQSNRLHWLLVILLAGPFFMVHAQAELIPVLNGQAVYDTGRNITWLANTNLAATEKFGVAIPEPGYMNLTKTLEWLDAMNESNYLTTLGDCRLPWFPITAARLTRVA